MDSNIRYQVFISSTYLDLVEERQEILMALLELNCIPSGMELFPAADENQWSYIKKVIDESDYYLVIVGGRYGSTDDKGISYTEKEYDYAIKTGKPVIAFIHSNPEELPVKKSEKTDQGREQLKKFIIKLETRLCKKWSNSYELGSVVSRSLIKLINNKPEIGYIRGDLASDATTLNQLRTKIQELKDELEMVKIAKPEDIEDLAQGKDVLKIMYHHGNRSYGSDASGLKLCDEPLEMTWDEILSLLGPSMFDEESQGSLRRKLENQIRKAHFPKESNYYSTDIQNEIFDSIITQIFSLGIIEKSSKKHTASDSNTYWSLTPYGEKVILKLKAIRK